MTATQEDAQATASEQSQSCDELRPNYRHSCLSCDAKPVADLYFKGQRVARPQLCGVCLFGESRMADPGVWND